MAILNTSAIWIAFKLACFYPISWMVTKKALTFNTHSPDLRPYLSFSVISSQKFGIIIQHSQLKTFTVATTLKKLLKVLLPHELSSRQVLRKQENHLFKQFWKFHPLPYTIYLLASRNRFLIVHNRNSFTFTTGCHQLHWHRSVNWSNRGTRMPPNQPFINSQSHLAPFYSRWSCNASKTFLYPIFPSSSV